MSSFIQFSDKMVPYEVFMRDLSSRIAEHLATIRRDPEYISQRQAYKVFGRANVDRWRNQGRVTPHQRPGKIEYSVAELRQQQLTIIDKY